MFAYKYLERCNKILKEAKKNKPLRHPNQFFLSVNQPWCMILDYSCVLDSLHETFIKNADVILDMTYGYVQFKKNYVF